MNKKLLALGRLKSGKMNKTEAAYAHYLTILLRAGEVAWFKFEGIKLKLADNTFLTVDFVVMMPNGQIELHDCKGSPGVFVDDAKVKMKVAAEIYPFVFKVVYPAKKSSGKGWIVEEI